MDGIMTVKTVISSRDHRLERRVGHRKGGGCSPYAASWLGHFILRGQRGWAQTAKKTRVLLLSVDTQLRKNRHVEPPKQHISIMALEHCPEANMV